MNNAARIYMQNLLSDRITYLAKQMLNCPPDDTAGLLVVASEARDAANALNELAQPAEVQKPAAEIRKMSDVFTAVARNVEHMRIVRGAPKVEGIEREIMDETITDILTAFNPEREAQRAATVTGEVKVTGDGPTPEQLSKTLEELGAELAARPAGKGNGKDSRRQG